MGSAAHLRRTIDVRVRGLRVDRRQIHDCRATTREQGNTQIDPADVPCQPCSGVRRGFTARCSKSVLRSVRPPSPNTCCAGRTPHRSTWRSFLHNHALGVAAIDMFYRAFGNVPAAIRDAHPGPPPSQDCPLRRHAASHRRLAVASGNRSVPMASCSSLSAARTATRPTARYSASGSMRWTSPKFSLPRAHRGGTLRRASHWLDPA